MTARSDETRCRRDRPRLTRAVGCIALLGTLVSLAVLSARAGSEGIGAREEARRILGRWLRPDGGYVLELREAPSGQGVEALYFNPRPIHVSRAELREAGGSISVFVELRDANYPGSTYTLLYDPKTDRLGGTYFQAVQRATYDVEFVRLR